MKIFTFALICLLILAACTSAPPTNQTNSQSQIDAAVNATIAAQKVNSTPASAASNNPTLRPTRTITSTFPPTHTQRPTSTKTITPMPKTGSYEKPIALGKFANLTSGGDKEFFIGISEVKRGDAAWQMLYDANMFNDPAPSGMEWIAVKIQVNYDQGPSGEVLEINTRAFNTVSHGSILDIPFYVPFDPEFDVSILPGGKGEGWVCGQVYQDDPNPLLLFGYLQSSKSGWYFSLVP